MRSPRTRVSVLVLLVFGMAAVPSTAIAARIEAVEGKSYRITPRHGPWMIFVASLQGESAPQASAALVYELRRIGIPAYTFSQRGLKSRVDTKDRAGRQSRRSYTARHEAISVIAGNYRSVKDWRAQKTLKFLKQYEPRSISGGTFIKTPGRPSPLSGAFLVHNPLLGNDSKDVGDLVRQLNRGERHTLFQNRGKYTLVVATFGGRSHTSLGDGAFLRASQQFQVSDSLDHAAVKARRLVAILRDSVYLAKLSQANPQLAELVGRQGLKAFVLHEKYRSIVTVGEFVTPDDPQVKAFHDLFRAKLKTSPQTGQLATTPEYILVPGSKSENPLEKILVFDPEPKLITVPRLK